MNRYHRRNKQAIHPFGFNWPQAPQPLYPSYFSYNFSQHHVPVQHTYSSYPHWSYQLSQPTYGLYHVGNNGPFPHPYPTWNTTTQKGMGTQSILSQFKKEDGTYDVNKLMDTAGQMVGAVNQVSSMVKSLSSTFKA